MRIVRRTRPVVLHAHGYKAAVAAVLAGRLAPGAGRADGPLLVVTFHNLWPAGAGARERAALAAVVRRATLVAVSQAVAETIRAAAPGAGVTVIGNGVALDRFAAADREAARATLGIGAAEPVVGFFGRLTREKGADLALAAIARLREAGFPARLIVAGDGPERALFSRLAGSETLYLGERADVPDLMAACDAVLVPSRAEGQSVVALEAYAAGRPIVATRVGGLAALAAAGGGLLVPPEDVEAMSEALRCLLADPEECAARGAAGRDYVRRHASAASAAATVAALYDRLLGENGRTGAVG
jgi:glycosyltransferase involved in cell wall biosynthesis